MSFTINETFELLFESGDAADGSAYNHRRQRPPERHKDRVDQRLIHVAE